MLIRRLIPIIQSTTDSSPRKIRTYSSGGGGGGGTTPTLTNTRIFNNSKQKFRGN